MNTLFYKIPFLHILLPEFTSDTGWTEMTERQKWTEIETRLVMAFLLTAIKFSFRSGSSSFQVFLKHAHLVGMSINFIIPHRPVQSDRPDKVI